MHKSKLLQHNGNKNYYLQITDALKLSFTNTPKPKLKFSLS